MRRKKKLQDWETLRPWEIPRSRAGKAYPELTGRQLWIMGLAAPLSTANYEDSDRLYPGIFVWKNGPSTQRAALEKAWGVTSQVDLLEVLVDLLDGGMRQHLRGRVGYPPLAWDHGRFVNLVRWGFAAGYLDEPTCWVLLEAVVAPVYRCYPGWGSYGLDFLVGRAFWLGKSEPRHEKALIRMWSLSPVPRGLWHRVPWEAGADSPAQVDVPATDAPTWDRYQGPTWTPVPVAVPAAAASPRIPFQDQGAGSQEGAALLGLVWEQADNGQLAEAFATAGTLVEQSRRRAADNPASAVALAVALLTAAGLAPDPATAVGLATEAAGVYRQLAARDPTARTSLLDALTVVAALLRKLGRGAEADTVLDEAAAVACQLAASDPVAHRTTVLGVVAAHGATQGADEAVRLGERAVAQARRLAAVHPHGGPAALACLLYGLVPRLAAADRLDVALALFTEATSIRRHVPGP